MTGAHSGRLWPIDRALPSQAELRNIVRTADHLVHVGHDWAVRDHNALMKAYIDRGGTVLEVVQLPGPCVKGCQAHYHVGQGR